MSVRVRGNKAVRLSVVVGAGPREQEGRVSVVVGAGPRSKKVGLSVVVGSGAREQEGRVVRDGRAGCAGTRR